MRRIIIICEGETEREFCQKTLYPFFISKDIFIQAPLIKKSMGGIVRWSELRNQILLHLKNDSAYVTTLIDYYGLYAKFQFPGWDASLRIDNKNERLDFLENRMKQSIEEELQIRFLPYLQLHEFEGLLFNDIEIFHQQIPPMDLVGEAELVRTFEQYPNPEMINDRRETSPSHRLGRIIKGYDKVVYGNILAEAIGLDRIRRKSPRFSRWMQNIEEIV